MVMQKMPAPLRFTPPMECLEVDHIAEGELWQYELKLHVLKNLRPLPNARRSRTNLYCL
jgi:hypothetical protein